MSRYLDPLDDRSVRAHLGPIGIVGAEGQAIHPIGFSAATQAAMASRYVLVEAWAKKYGRLPTRVEEAWLATARPVDIVSRMTVLGARDPSHCGTEPSFGADHKGMRAVYTEAFRRVRGYNPSPAQLEAVMAVGSHETGYGTSKFRGGLGPGMHNHGAVQCCKPSADGSCPDNAFLSQDTHPTKAGNVPYAVCFKRYENDADGAADLIKHVGELPLTMMAKWGNSIAAFAAGMYLNHYFESYNAEPKVLADPKNKAVRDAIIAIGKTQPAGKDRDKLVDPERAGRVLMYAIALNSSANAAVKQYGGKRQTSFLPTPSGATMAKAGAVVGGVAVVGVAGYLLMQRKTKRSA